MDVKKLNNELGNADLILIDQILKNRFHNHMRILDAGCGEGRNLVYFVNNNYNIYGIDPNPEAVKMAKLFCKSISKDFEAENIQAFSIEDNPFPDSFFNVVLCINVLHSVSDQEEFFNVLDNLIRLLHTGGFLFLSMKSKFCLPVLDEKYKTNDAISQDTGEQAFYLTNDLLAEIMAQYRLLAVEPVKTIIVENNSYTYLF